MTEEDLEPRTDREEMDIGVSIWNHFVQMTIHGRKQTYSADATCRMEPEPPVWGLDAHLWQSFIVSRRFWTAV